MKLDQWLSGIYQEEREKQAAADLDALMDGLPIEEVMKLAGVVEPAPMPDTKSQQGDDLEKTADAKFQFMDKLARQLARQDTEVIKEAGAKTAQLEMEKEDAFTTPEAKAKAKVMSRAMKMSKGAPTKVRKAAVSMAGKEMAKSGSVKLALSDAEYTEQPGFFRGQLAASRALRASPEGAAQILADKELIKRRLNLGLGRGAVGGGLGAGAGALAAKLTGHSPGAGAALGGLLGGFGGFTSGVDRANTDALANRGIRSRWGGLSIRMTPEAKEKYLGEGAKKRSAKD
jgi:hypothetical protein